MNIISLKNLIIAIGLVGILILAIGIRLRVAGQVSVEPTPAVTASEVAGANPLKAELEAAKAKLKAVEEKVSTLASERGILVTELSQARARAAELMMNQPPGSAVQYGELKDRYNQKAVELERLQTTYNELLLRYEELAKAYVLCSGTENK